MVSLGRNVLGAGLRRPCSSSAMADALGRSEQMARIKSLRGATGAPVGKVKQALENSAWDEERARQFLRKAGLAAANKIAGRAAAEGLVAMRIARDGKSAALVEVNAETDFVNRNALFQNFARLSADAVLGGPRPAVAAYDPEMPPSPTGSARCGVTELGGDALGGIPVLGSDKTLGEMARELAGELGENVTLRRAVVVDVRPIPPHVGDADGGRATLVRGYLHNAPQGAADASPDGRPDLGEQGTLVALHGATPGTEAEPEGLDNPARRAVMVAMQVTALRPLYMHVVGIPQDVQDLEAKTALEKYGQGGKDASIVDKIVEAYMKKWRAETTLECQPWMMDGKQTVQQFLKSGAHNLELACMAHFKVGEGVEREEKDFAAEVRRQLSAAVA